MTPRAPVSASRLARTERTGLVLGSDAAQYEGRIVSDMANPSLMDMATQLAALKELAARAKLRNAIESVFETVPGEARFCVRRLEVVEHVSRVLGIRIINNRIFARVERVARDMGWEPIKNGNRSLFRCAKRKDQDQDEALLVSEANRHDSRW